MPSRFCPRWFSLCLLLLLIPFGNAQDMTLYTDSLQNGWQDWSWGSTRNLANSAPVKAGTKSIAVSLTQGWGALFLHREPFNSTLYRNVTFWIHGGTSGGQTLRVTGHRLGGEALSKSIGPLKANAWIQIAIPLFELGIANKTDVDGIWLQDTTGSPQATWYIDEIKLSEAAPRSAKVAVDAIEVVRKVDSRHFGVNTAIWDGSFTQPETVQYLAAAGTKILRFPGGSISDTYHWATGRSDGNNWSWVTNFDHFAAAAIAVKSQAYITVNYGSGTPQEAADWVRYSNITKGYGFKYWEIGNENYGAWENDLNNRPHDPATYATRAKDFISQMKAVDPTIKVGVVVINGEDSYANYSDLVVTNPRTKVSHSGWTPVVLTKLRQLGVTPDFVIYHRYPQGPWNESDSGLLQSSATWKDDAADLRQQLRDYLGLASNRVEIVCTENNSVYTSPGKQTTSLVNGLFYADSLGQLLQTEINSLVWWDLRNSKDEGNNNSPLLYGWREYGDYGMLSASSERYPSYFALKLFKFFARGGDFVVRATSDHPLLAVYAVRRLNGSLCILVVNKSPTTALSANVVLHNYGAATSAATYTYGIPSDDAARTGIGSADIRVGSIPTGQSFTATFSPYSMTVVSMAGTPPPPPPTAPAGLAATTISSSRIDLVWDDLAIDETEYRVERSADLIYWKEIASLGANSEAFASTGLLANKAYHYRVRAKGPGGMSAYSNVAKARTLSL